MSAVMGTRHPGPNQLTEEGCRARRRAWWLLTLEQPIESEIPVRGGQEVPVAQGSQGGPGGVRGILKPLHMGSWGQGPRLRVQCQPLRMTSLPLSLSRASGCSSIRQRGVTRSEVSNLFREGPKSRYVSFAKHTCSFAMARFCHRSVRATIDKI